MRLGIRAKLFLTSLALILVALVAGHGYARSELGDLLLPSSPTPLGAGELERHLDRIILMAVLLGLAVAAGVAILAARLATRNVEHLTRAARRMAEGDLVVRARTEATDEFGELGRALDALAEGLAGKAAEVEQERTLLRGILAGMQEGVLVLDGDGVVVVVNPALREMLLLGQHAEGRRLLELVRDANLKELLDQAGARREPVIGEVDVVGLRPRRLLVRAAPVAGRDRAVFAVFVDVTEVRRLESLRRDFVANVSHELRTPVTAIRSAAETLDLVLETDPPAAKQFVAIVDRNASRLHALVEDLLDLSRIESQKVDLDPQPLAVTPLAERVAELFTDRAARRGVRLSVVGAGRVLADRRAVEHVLTNLIDNAVKYTAEGAEVSVVVEPVEGGRVRITVKDSGPGIEPRHLPRLFERFYRVDPGRSREQGGTGLGLSIVKHLVEAMGGEVGVESALGEGTAFWFSLPAA